MMISVYYKRLSDAEFMLYILHGLTYQLRNRYWFHHPQHEQTPA